jgi:GTPase SAR1 family protein
LFLASSLHTFALFARSISVLVGNKCDLVDQRKVQYDEARQLAEQWKCPFLETSAKDKVNNEEIFLTVSCPAIS